MQTSGASRRENADVYLLFEIRIEKMNFVVPDKRVTRALIRDPYADGFPSTTQAGGYGSRLGGRDDVVRDQRQASCPS